MSEVNNKKKGKKKLLRLFSHSAEGQRMTREQRVCVCVFVGDQEKRLHKIYSEYSTLYIE